MRFGISIRSVDDVALAVEAEQLGFDFVWATDSQLLCANPWMVLALAAQRTTRIRLGPGLAIAGLRLAPVTANCVATLNHLAPGRTFLGIGTGNTAMRLMGQRPMPVARFAEYVRVVRALVQGEEVEYTLAGVTRPIRFQARDLGHRDGFVPFHVGGIGPKAQALAGELGDGLVTSLPRAGTPATIRASLERGAARANRTLDGFETTALLNLMLLDDDEAPDSPRIVRQCGPAIMANIHYLVSLHEETGAEPPDYVRPFWDEYLAYHRSRDAAHAHQELHRSHYSRLEPGEERFITPDVVRAFCLFGRPAEVVEQLHALEAAGIDGVVFIYPEGGQRQFVDFAQRVMRHMGGPA